MSQCPSTATHPVTGLTEQQRQVLDVESLGLPERSRRAQAAAMFSGTWEDYQAVLRTVAAVPAAGWYAPLVVRRLTAGRGAA